MLRNNLVLSAYVDSKLDNQCTSKSLLDIGILLYTGFETRQTSISLTESLQSADRDCLVLRTTIWLVLDHYERETLRFQWRRLDEELVFPQPQIGK